MYSSISKYMLGPVLGLAAGLLIGTSLRANAALGQSKSPETLSTTNQADKIVKRFLERTRALQTLVCTMKAIETDPKGPTTEVTYHIAYDGPRKVAIHRTSVRTKGKLGNVYYSLLLAYSSDIVANGTNYYVYDAASNHYVLHPLNPDGWAKESHGAGVFSDSFYGDVLFGSGPNPPPEQAFKGAVYLGQEAVDGVSCDKLRMTNGSQINEYWIGRTDGLLRKELESVQFAKGPMVTTDVYTILQTKGPLSPQEFAIKPPPGATQVDHL